MLKVKWEHFQGISLGTSFLPERSCLPNHHGFAERKEFVPFTDQGPVVQSIVRLTSLLTGQLVKSFMTLHHIH